ncbi:MAG: DNA ligase D [Myxococcota bacterium]
MRRAVPWPLAPQLPKLVDSPPAGEGWVHELKHDGYRLLVRLQGGTAQLLTRNGQDWTALLQPVARAFEGSGLGDAVLDGELVALDDQGRSSFSALQRTLHAAPETLYVYVFDLLAAGDADLRGVPLLQRKQALKALLPGVGRIRYGDHVDADGAAVLAQACALGAEGIVSKRATSTYHSGRHDSWRGKCALRVDLRVGGWLSRNQALSALLLADPDADPPRYAGKVGTGFDEAERERLLGLLRPLEVDAAAVADPPRRARGDEVHWVRPELSVEVRAAGWTPDRRLRHPSYLGVHVDRGAGVALARPAADRAPPRVTSPDRVVYPALGLTKLEVATWVQRMAPALLPGLVDRPLSLVRCPKGVGGACFFQKHRENLPASVLAVDIPGDDQPYVAIRDEEGLLALVQHGVLELHPWGARTDRLDRPDRLVMDLDPDEALPFAAVVAAALALRERLAALGLASFVRTTGGKGLHVVVPIERRTPWAEAKGFTRALAQAMAADAPRAFTANPKKAARKGRIFVDYLRNGQGATAIASWSPRALPGATVAVPLRWEDLTEDLDPQAFTLRTVAPPARDPWAALDDTRQRLTKALLSGD